MRLRREMIERIAGRLAESLLRGEYISLDVDPKELKALIHRVIEEDLLVEDRLNEEVKEILHAHANIIDKSNVDYSRMFNLVKNKLVKERNLIL